MTMRPHEVRLRRRMERATAGPRAPEAAASAGAQWRALVPWTNDEVAAALEVVMADLPDTTQGRFLAQRLRWNVEWLRAGKHLTSKMLAMALPVLVKTCGVCGKTALYRIGNDGRCRAHKDVTPAAIVARRRQVEAQRAEEEREQAHRALREASQRAFARRTKRHRRR